MSIQVICPLLAGNGPAPCSNTTIKKLHEKLHEILDRAAFGMNENGLQVLLLSQRGIFRGALQLVQHCTAQYYYTAQFYYLSLGHPLTLAATYRTSALPRKRTSRRESLNVCF